MNSKIKHLKKVPIWKTILGIIIALLSIILGLVIVVVSSKSKSPAILRLFGFIITAAGIFTIYLLMSGHLVLPLSNS